MGIGKRAFYLCAYLRGLPLGFKVDSRPKRLAMRFVQRSPPEEVPRARLEHDLLQPVVFALHFVGDPANCPFSRCA